MRDAILREDASRVRKGSAPEVLASLRDVVVLSLGRLNQPGNAAAIRRLMMNLDQAIELRSTPIQE